MLILDLLLELMHGLLQLQIVSTNNNKNVRIDYRIGDDLNLALTRETYLTIK